VGRPVHATLHGNQFHRVFKPVKRVIVHITPHGRRAVPRIPDLGSGGTAAALGRGAGLCPAGRVGLIG
jgi:hypothetical protein